MAGTLIAPVEDGKIVETDSQASMKKAKENDSTYSKDTFLRLLVAEVQNQDPLEPTSNTEWISQYATFSELEAMQNMSDSFDLTRASSLVGKTVVLQTTSESGKTSTIQGKVDYVTYEAGKAYLSVNGSLYSMDDLHDIVDTDYLSAFDKVYEWSVKLNKLPSYENLTLDDAGEVEALYGEYDKMSDYEKTFVASENADKIKKYHEKIEALKKQAEEAKRLEEEKKAAEEAKRLEEEKRAAEEAKRLEEEKRAEEAKKPEEEETGKPEESGTTVPPEPEKPEEDGETEPEGTGEEKAASGAGTPGDNQEGGEIGSSEETKTKEV